LRRRESLPAAGRPSPWFGLFVLGIGQERVPDRAGEKTLEEGKSRGEKLSTFGKVKIPRIVMWCNKIGGNGFVLSFLGGPIFLDGLLGVAAEY